MDLQWPALDSNAEGQLHYISDIDPWNFNDGNYNQCRVFVWCPELFYVFFFQE